MPLDASRQKQMMKTRLGVLAHTCYPRTQESEVEGSKLSVWATKVSSWPA